MLLSFGIDTRPTHFIRWLLRYRRVRAISVGPEEEWYCTIAIGKPNKDDLGAVSYPLHGLVATFSETGKVASVKHSWPRFGNLTFMPIADNRCLVEFELPDRTFVAKCALAQFLRCALEEAARLWPESAEAINPHFQAGHRAEATVESTEEEAGPRVPRRLPDRLKWRDTWPIVKSRLAKRENYSKIAQHLQLHHPDLGYSPEIVADIAKAGSAGLLDVNESFS